MCKVLKDFTEGKRRNLALILANFIRYSRQQFKRGCPQKSNIRRPRLKNRFCSNFAQIYLIVSENAPYIF